VSQLLFCRQRVMLGIDEFDAPLDFEKGFKAIYLFLLFLVPTCSNFARRFSALHNRFYALLASTPTELKQWIR
jgi:hypothetical protein